MSKKVTENYKKVRNVSANKREFVVDGRLISLLPNQVVKVPTDCIVPTGIGLQII